MPVTNLDCEKCSAKWKNFLLLTETEMKMINENRYEAFFRPGEIMIKQGSPASHALFMANGMAKTYIEGINGKNFMMGLAMPGKLIMSPGAFTTLRNTYSVAAITSVKACFISTDIFRQITKLNGSFAESLLQDFSERNQRAYNRLVSQAQKRMSGRLAEILLYFADEIFHSSEYEMVLSRQEIGEMSNMAKECVVRILKEFEESGVIYSDSSKIKILDKKKLVLISEKG